jgi:electron transport complex protein RnfG
MLGQSISKNSLILGAFALVTASVLAVTHQGTKERIAAAERAAAQKALFEVLPEDQHDNDLLNATRPIPARLWKPLGLKNGGDMYIAEKDGEVAALIFPAVAPDGYSGDIRLIIGVRRDGSISGVRVLSHAETPGLGDKVELAKSDWILGFNDKSLQQPSADEWKVKKDGGSFDQFTGATITPRAVVRQVKKALTVFEENRDALLQSPNAPAPGSAPTAQHTPATPKAEDHE